jgi:UDP-N-acetylmuramyl pentapeptide phosphotransferase/UDP-N-acetylglucosamine-1-phosphate transferase
MISLLLAIGFIIISHPQTYAYSDQLLKRFRIRTTYDNASGLPTMMGLFIHAGVMMMLAMILLHKKQPAPTIRITRPKTDNLNTT